MKKGLIVHVFIFNTKHQLLILKRASNAEMLAGFWDIPGGTLEDGENPVDGVIRETKEESNLDIKNPELFFCTSNVDKKKNTQFIRLLFFVKASSFLDIKISPEEHTEYRRIKLSEITQYNTVDYLSRSLKVLEARKCLSLKS